MPSHRAILVDIAEMRLDPTVPYTVTRTAGRLATVELQKPTQEEKAVQMQSMNSSNDDEVVTTVDVKSDPVELQKKPKSLKQPKETKKSVAPKKAVIFVDQTVDVTPQITD